MIELFGTIAGGVKGSMGFRKPIGGERSKYMPHQGKQEIARRVRQDDALHAKAMREQETAISKYLTYRNGCDIEQYGMMQERFFKGVENA